MIVHETNMSFLPPSLDFITEEALNVDEPVIDTQRWFEPDALTKLNGRKYLNLSTVRSMAQAAGYMLVPTGTVPCECASGDEYDGTTDTELIERALAEVVEAIRSRVVLPKEATKGVGQPANTSAKSVPARNK